MTPAPGQAALIRVYAVLAAVGAVLPWLILVPWIAGGGATLAAFWYGPYANAPAALFSADVLWSSVVFLVFVVAESRRSGVRAPWLSPLVLCLFGLCCALPLFLWQREKARVPA